MNYSAMFKSICLPSKIYFVLSVIGILLSLLSPDIFGDVSVVIHIFHFIYVVFWTWVLNLICKAGYKWISWVLVLAPFVLIFLLFVFVLNDIAVIQKEQPDSVPIIVLSSQ